MNLKIAFLLTGVAAVAAIVAVAAVVFSGSRPMAGPEAVAEPDAQRLSIEAVEAEAAQPDPAAAGMIVAVSSSNYYYWMTPRGELATMWRNPYPQNGVSSDGRWQAGIDWDQDEAFLRITDLSNPQNPEGRKSVRMSMDLTSAEWAPGAPLLAALDSGALYLVDATSGASTPLADRVTAYAWGEDDRLIYATNDDGGPHLWTAGLEGAPIRVAALTGAIERFYVSPESDQIVYTQDDAEGWRLLSLDPADGSIKDFGNLGRAWLRDYGTAGFDPVSRTPVAEAPELAVAWSPDGGMFAVGPVSKPYAMHVIAPGSKWQVRSFNFEEGYAGELAWSPDGTELAISTYSLDRTQHEVYVMDVAAGSAPRHLLDGCKIVWSPDGLFLAVKREPHKATGVAAIRVETGYHWALTSLEFVPLAWGGDEQEALALALKPVPYAVQLGK